MRDGDPLRPFGGQPFDPGAHGPIESLARSPHHGGPEVGRPVGHLFVVADHRNVQRDTGADDVGGHGAGQFGPLGGAEGGTEATLGLPERLDRNEDDLVTDAWFSPRRVLRTGVGHPGHRVSVRAFTLAAVGRS